MSLACREQELDALLAGELSPADAERVRTHAEGCAACTHTLAWLKLERGWMAQRARRMPERPALNFAALESRLAGANTARPVAVSAPEARRAERASPRRGHWSHRGVMALGAAAAVAFMLFGVTQVRPVNSLEESWSQEVLASGLLQACVDTSGEEMAATEARFNACLIASPALASSY
jgi:anti-sigma factor RsiW